MVNTVRVAVSIAVIAVWLSGCMPRDRTPDAERIAEQIAAMPGVVAAQQAYVNDFENGAQFDLEVDVTAASDQQIETVAARIDELKGGTFAGHRERISYALAEGTVVDKNPHPDAGALVTAVRVLRGLRGQITGGMLTVRFEDQQMNVEMLPGPDDTDHAVRHAVSALAAVGRPVAVYIRSDQPGRQSSWNVRLPLARSELDRIIELRDSLPVTVIHIGVGQSRVDELSVDLGDPARAMDRATAMLTALQPSEELPIAIQWRMTGALPSETDDFVACAPPAPAAAAIAPTFSALSDWFAGQYAGCTL